MPTLPPRVRFAPAPSGWLHVGGARTALFNWLYARHHRGDFVLRIEDTDADRVNDASMEGMLDALHFLNLDWDEGPQRGGPYGPYRQSERMPLYEAVANALLKTGDAYDAYETPEELAAAREAAQREGRTPGYDGAHRELTDDQREAFLEEGRQPVLRLRTPDEGAVGFDDAVRGAVEFAWADISDFIILRADSTPTYFLANTVDDLAMGIDFVARGEDLLSATPRQLYLADLLLRDGLLDRMLHDNQYPVRPAERQRPRFAHLPIIVGADRRKLSKRHGDVAVDEFRRQGYLPETLVNFLALCGWSADATTERFDSDELIERFGFERVGRNPAFFDTDKLRSMNGDRIKELNDDELAERLQPYLAEAGLIDQPPLPPHAHVLRGLAPLLRERIQTLAEAVPLVAFCFTPAVEYDERAVAKHLKGTAADVLAQAEAALGDLATWDAESIQQALDGIADRLGVGRGKAFQPVRVAVAGTAVSPPLPETLALMERELVLQRIQAAGDLVRS